MAEIVAAMAWIARTGRRFATVFATVGLGRGVATGSSPNESYVSVVLYVSLVALYPESRPFQAQLVPLRVLFPSSVRFKLESTLDPHFLLAGICSHTHTLTNAKETRIIRILRVRSWSTSEPILNVHLIRNHAKSGRYWSSHASTKNPQPFHISLSLCLPFHVFLYFSIWFSLFFSVPAFLFVVPFFSFSISYSFSF